jgi:hypothetical protein
MSTPAPQQKQLEDMPPPPRQLKRSSSSYYRAVEAFNALWKMHMGDERTRGATVRLAGNVGLFAASIVLIGNYGELLAV